MLGINSKVIKIAHLILPYVGQQSAVLLNTLHNSALQSWKRCKEDQPHDHGL